MSVDEEAPRIEATEGQPLVPGLPAESIRVLVNLESDHEPPAPVGAAVRFHRRLAGYAPTPLRTAEQLAAYLGVANVWIKDESARFDLPAFKMLGVSWAGYRAVLDRLGIARDPGWDLDRLARAVSSAAPVCLVAPTDGNHGHAVARFARLIGVRARIFMPAGTVDARIRAIKSEGAIAELVRGGFDDAVAAAGAATREAPEALLLAGTSTGINDEVAEWVIEGYQTIGWELSAQLPNRPDLVLVPIGVGALAAALGRTLTLWDGGDRPVLAGVEPHEAASTMASVAAGRILALPGSTNSIMAGLSCGTPSLAAWPTVRSAYDLYVAVGLETARLGMRVLQKLGVSAGECSGGVVGALLQLGGRAPGLVSLSPKSTVLMIATEGITDPDSFAALVAP